MKGAALIEDDFGSSARGRIANKNRDLVDFEGLLWVRYPSEASFILCQVKLLGSTLQIYPRKSTSTRIRGSASASASEGSHQEVDILAEVDIRIQDDALEHTETNLPNKNPLW